MLRKKKEKRNSGDCTTHTSAPREDDIHRELVNVKSSTNPPFIATEEPTPLCIIGNLAVYTVPGSI